MFDEDSDIVENLSLSFVTTIVFLFLLIGIGVLVFFPFINIWSINQLFGLQIEYSIYNWFASLWLSIFLLRPVFHIEDKKKSNRNQ
jgi:membrane protein implicated in regulation of membrane protease activity